MPRIVGHGIDMIKCFRVQDLAQRCGEGFLARVFAAGELGYCRVRKRTREHLAGRFAVEESAFKYQ